MRRAAVTLARRALRIDSLSAGPTSGKMTPSVEASLYQPGMSVSRIEEKMADVVLSRTLVRLSSWYRFPGSSNIKTKRFRERSVRLRSRQRARRNIGSGRRPCSSSPGVLPTDWFSRRSRERSLALESQYFMTESAPVPPCFFNSRSRVSKTGAILSGCAHSLAIP